VEGDIQFLAFVVGNGFLAQRQQTALFLKGCLHPRWISLVHATANLGSSGQQRISLVAQ